MFRVFLFFWVKKGTVMDTFSMKTRIILGDGLEEAVQNCRMAFVVTDEFMAKSNAVSYVIERLTKNHVDYQVFSDVRADPDIDMITEGVGKILNCLPDTVIAFGGGSAMDAAKAIMYFAKREAGLQNALFIAIPTTSGTGSEVTSFSVITDREKNLKYPLVDDSLLPDLAILDAQLTRTLPAGVTANTGMDVFTHAVEAYVATGHNDFSDAFAEKSIRLIQAHLSSAFFHADNLQARQGMHNASCLAGIAFNEAGLGLNHGMAHAVGAMFHLPHGRANAILLPYIMKFNASLDTPATQTTERYTEIAKMLGMDTYSSRQGAMALIQWTSRFTEKLQIPSSLRAAGIQENAFNEALPKMATSAIADRCTKTNPRPCSEEQAATLLRQAYSGKL